VVGAFAASEMAEWFSAGYFTMNLQVKRGCDDKFQPLGEHLTSEQDSKESPDTVDHLILMYWLLLKLRQMLDLKLDSWPH